MTEAEKKYIDALDVYALLYKARFAPIGDPSMQGARGEYWMVRLPELRSRDNAAYVAASKDMGWGK